MFQFFMRYSNSRLAKYVKFDNQLSYIVDANMVRDRTAIVSSKIARLLCIGSAIIQRSPDVCNSYITFFLFPEMRMCKMSFW